MTISRENTPEYIYLNNINSPKDVKELPRKAMEPLAEEMRRFLIESVSKTGGHLASNLGVVELSIALHRVFDAPKDHIIFDVGHQCYVHKMITGRREMFGELRQPGGISGFTKMDESEYDCFGAGHSSTSISAALGFAEADRLRGNDSYTVAVVGDGAFTGGMIHEALNNCRKNLKLIIILNENEMSISKNIGLFAKNLSKIRMRSGYFKAKRFTGRVLKRIPFIGKGLFRFTLKVKKTLKNVMYRSNYFEDLGLYYLGPVDGNDYDAVERALLLAKQIGDNAVIHLKTSKGKGYEPAEKEPGKYHGVPPMEAKPMANTLSEEFGKILTELAREDSRICAITAAMADGTGLIPFKEAHGERFFDVGIAEEHAVTFGAGLAAAGMRPAVAVYSTFLQRAYDNLIHDVALQKLPLTVCIDRSGLNVKDGPTHHGIFDVSFLSGIPEMVIYTPVTVAGLKRSLIAALYGSTPAAVRYANVCESNRVVEEFYVADVPRKPTVLANFGLSDSPRAVIVTYGNIVNEALKANDELKAQGIEAGIILLEYLKPYDKLAIELDSLIPDCTEVVILLEEGIKNGGAAMLIRDELCRIERLAKMKTSILAIDDSFVHLGKGETAYSAAGISQRHIVEAVNECLR